jgi:hypothetical protein
VRVGQSLRITSDLAPVARARPAARPGVAARTNGKPAPAPAAKPRAAHSPGAPVAARGG